jgi:hypothetical protein
MGRRRRNSLLNSNFESAMDLQQLKLMAGMGFSLALSCILAVFFYQGEIAELRAGDKSG